MSREDNLDFRHRVSEVPPAQKLPENIHKSVRAETSDVPNYLSATREYGASTNWMGALGSYVATKASTQLAKQIGTELGKEPYGDFNMPLTDFDTTMQDSYKTQAQATLGLQADKLITDSNIEMSKAPRMTSELISQTNKKISVGLQNIFKNAPSEIRPHLELAYGESQLSFIQSMNHRMIKEGIEDDRNNTIQSSNSNAENALRLGIQGNVKAALAFVDSTKVTNDASVARRSIDPKTAKTNIDTVRISARSGLIIHDYENAKDKEQFLKDIADKGDKSDPDYYAINNNLLSHINQLKTLRAQEESITISKFQTDLINGVPITGSRLDQLKNELSPENYHKTLLGYYKYIKKSSSENDEVQTLLSGGLEKPQVASIASTDAINKAFDEKVRSYIKENPNVGLAEAEGHVAAQSAVPIPHVISQINAQLKSFNPVDIESAIAKMNYMYSTQKGANLDGVSHQSKLFAATYEQLRRSLPAELAAKQTYDTYYNNREGEKEVLDQKWNTVKKTIDQSSGGALTYYSNLVGIDPTLLSDPIAFESAASLAMESNFYISHADIEASKKVLMRDFQQTWGESHVNGLKQITYFSLEKALDLPTNEEQEKPGQSIFSLNKLAKSNSVTLAKLMFNKPYSAVGLIQDDIIENVNDQLKSINDDYKKGKGLFYFEIEPRQSIQAAKESKNKGSYDLAHPYENPLVKYSNGSPIIIHRIWQNGTRDTYRLMVKANPTLTQVNNSANYNGAWDIIVVSDTGGYTPLSSIAPNLNKQFYYKINTEKIRSLYFKHYGDLNG